MIQLLTITAIFSMLNTFVFLIILVLWLVTKTEGNDHLKKIQQESKDWKDEVREKLNDIINLISKN